MAAATDPFELERFVEAQAGVYPAALAELCAGQKRGHWMWFIFPQLAGLGQSEMARRYGIRSLEEARAYLAHPLLGPRMRECIAAVIALEGCTAEAVFGYPDVRKFQSSLTLFHRAAPGETIFRAALAQYYRGASDPATLSRLSPERRP